MDTEGFSGRDGRTTIFDYWTVDTVSRWRNGGKFGGKKLTEEEKDLQAFYTHILHLCNEEKALREGLFYDLMYVNPGSEDFNPKKTYAFLRRAGKELLLVATNFTEEEQHIAVNIPVHAFEWLGITPSETAKATELLTGEACTLCITPDAPCRINLPAFSGVVLKMKR